VTARLRPELAELPAYTPGKTVPGAIKLASNETVHGPLPSVRAAIAAATETINRYPDNGHVELKEQLAGFLSKDGDVPPERIAVGCGSVSLCQQLIQITCSVGDEVVFGWRSFEVYPLQVRVAGATPVQVPLHNHTFDLDAMRAAITMRALVDNKSARRDIDLVGAEIEQNIHSARSCHGPGVQAALARHEAEIKATHSRRCCMQDSKAVPV
jgi:histidinol-phosphate aminotransferase